MNYGFDTILSAQADALILCYNICLDWNGKLCMTLEIAYAKKYLTRATQLVVENALD